MNDSADWRDRYARLAEQAEQAEARHAEAEQDLIRLFNRVSVAVTGLDAFLDGHLVRLRKALREGYSTRVAEQIKALGDDLLKAGEQRQRPGVLDILLERLQLPAGTRKEVRTLWAEMANEPDKAVAARIERLAELLGLSLAAAPQAPARSGRGVFGRLLRRDGPPPNRLLRALLDGIEWPDILRESVNDLRARLADDAPADAWVEVVRAISDLVLHALVDAQTEAHAAEDFLARLNERLVAIDQHVIGESERREQSRASSERLGAAVNNDVGSMSAQVNASTDLGQLQAAVVAHLDIVQGRVREHLADEAHRRAQAEDAAEQMREQVRQLEKDTFDLRRQVAQTYEQAMCDPLTGLANRRAYDDRVAQEFARWKRFGDPLALVVWDIDNFKKINDRFGHKAGDRALRLIGQALAQGLRETDFIARYGGEEFVVLLPGAGAEDAQRIAEVMRKAVEGSGMHSHNEPIPITVSGGSAVCVQGDTAEALFERADQAMYQAKRTGKNRVVAS